MSKIVDGFRYGYRSVGMVDGWENEFYEVFGFEPESVQSGDVIDFDDDDDVQKIPYEKLERWFDCGGKVCVNWGGGFVNLESVDDYNQYLDDLH